MVMYMVQNYNIWCLEYLKLVQTIKWVLEAHFPLYNKWLPCNMVSPLIPVITIMWTIKIPEVYDQVYVSCMSPSSSDNFTHNNHSR